MAKKDLQKLFEAMDIPNSIGVYKFFNENSEPIYVGKSVNLRRRMQQYLLASKNKKFRKSRMIVRDAVYVEFEICPDEKAALLRENELIHLLKPRFNTAGAFSFLYPVIAAKYSDRRLILIRTTMPGVFSGFQLFGAFRDRHLVKEMFERLEYLLPMIGHKEPHSRMKDIPEADYTRRTAYREVSEEFWPHLQSFFGGANDEFLRVLFNKLLSHNTAIANAKEVETSLKVLRDFFRQEAQRLFRVCRDFGMTDTFIQQEQRDALFIKVQSGPSD